MIRYQNWFDRRFAFDFPPSMFPNIVERLRGTPARLAERLAGLPRDVLTRRASGGWSVQEHAGHLLDLGALDLARVDDYEAARAVLAAADRENRKTIDAVHNARALGEILGEFRRERAELVRRLEALDDALVERVAIHPRLGVAMRVVDFAYFVAEHDDHHLAVVSALLRGE